MRAWRSRGPTFIAPQSRTLLPLVRVSRLIFPIAPLALAGTLLVFATAHAQTPATDSTHRTADSLSLDSLRARLERTEAAIAVLRAQLAGEAESAVHTRSRFHAELFAQVLTSSFVTWGRANNMEVPLTALAPAPASTRPPTDASLGLTVNQTRFGAATTIADVAGGSFQGDIDLDLFGGDPYAPGDRPIFPTPRLRTARGQLVWTHTELMFGSDVPLISMETPVTLAGVGIPDFSGAGNLWNWLGQIRLTQDLASVGSGNAAMRFAIQGAVMEPYASINSPTEPDDVDAGERSTRPAVEARLRMRWGGDDAGAMTEAQIGDPGGEIGVGMHRSWVATGPGTSSESHAVSVDAHAVVVRGLELRGEGYVGTLMRGLGGGGIGQSFGAAPAGSPPGSIGAPIRDAAGWAQVNVQPHPLVLTGVGCGVDLVNRQEAPSRLQNTACAVHAEWRPAQPVVIGVEYRQIGTRTTTGTYGVRHLNLAMGFEL